MWLGQDIKLAPGQVCRQLSIYVASFVDPRHVKSDKKYCTFFWRKSIGGSSWNIAV
jgi:hypothetical protein